MDLYLVRHGQSLANAGLTDELDSALTSLGERQAEFAAARLQTEGLTRVYVSPLRRTLQTVAPTCKATGLAAELYAGVCEFFSVRHPEYLEFQGLAPDQISQEFPFVTLTEDFPCAERWWPQALEEYHHVYDRAVNMRNIILERFAGTDEKILIVSHAETLGRLTEAFLRVPPNPEGAPWSDNCAISRLYCPADTNAPAESIYLNETAHLAEKTTSRW